MAEPKRVVVKFTENYAPYVKGDVAGFDKEDLESLTAAFKEAKKDLPFEVVKAKADKQFVCLPCRFTDGKDKRIIKT